MFKRARFLSWAVLVSLVFFNGWAQAEDEMSVSVADDVEMIVERHPARGKFLLLWLAPEYGFREAHRSMARRLSEQGIEVWQSDVVESQFLPPGSSSLKRLEE